MLLPVTSIARTSSASSSVPMCILRQPFVHFCARPCRSVDAAFGPAMLARIPRAFPFGLDACAIDEQVKWPCGAVIRQAHVQCCLTSAYGAEIRRGPVQPNQPQQALDEPGCLAKWHAKQDLQRQTGLNSGITELLAPTALAAWRRCPNHLRTKPYRQRSTLLHAFIVKRPIRGFVFRRGQTAHRPLLSPWIHAVNPISPFVQQSCVRVKNTKPGRFRKDVAMQ
jgi:hypothetical protein